MTNTTLAQVNLNECDCSPVFECLIAQKYIADVVLHSNSAADVYLASIMNAKDDRTGWLEDGTARKSQIVKSERFATLPEALTYVSDFASEASKDFAV